MAYLELAESGIDYFQNIQQADRTLSQTFEQYPEDLYIFIPDDETGQNGIWVREDYFDDLTDDEWERTMDGLADYQPEMMNGIFSRMRENIAARRQRRSERKETRQTTRTARIEGREGGLFGGKLKGFISSLIPGGEQPYIEPGVNGGRGFEVGFTTEQPTFFDKNKGWILPVGGLLIVGGIVMATRSKDDKKKK